MPDQSPDPKPTDQQPTEERSPLARALSRAGQLMVLLAQHLDRAIGEGVGEGGEMDELGRAWVRASQLEQLLRGVLPPGATDSIEVADPHADEASTAMPDRGAPRGA
jgi:hypothetical protein